MKKRGLGGKLVSTVMKCLVAFALALFGVAGVRAVTTRHFSLDSARVLAAGKLDGTTVHSDGSVRPGVETRRLALAGVGVARALLVRSDGTAFVGTGNQGTIYKVANDQATVFAETKELAVTSLATGFGGALFAATIPKAKIFRVDAAGKTSVFATPDKAEHVWALAFDEKRATLFAGTGPEGKVFAIDAKGKSEVYLDTDATHVMALALDRDGTLYLGTDGEALLHKVRAPGRSEVLYDFEGNEITALAVRDGVLAVAANNFPRPTPTPQKPKSDDAKDDGKTTDKTESDKGTERPKPGSGVLWRVDAGGRARKLFAPDEGHLTAVEWADGGAIYAASGKSGDIFRVEDDGSYASWIDVDERQVLALALSGAPPMFTTGDGAAVYRVVVGKAREATWTSKVLDAEFLSRWGGLSWRGDGKLQFQTRSGNTDKPEHGWSEWSSPLTASGPIRSPAARFLQIRARLDTDKPSLIYAVTAYYVPQNQPATLRNLNVAPKKSGAGGRGGGGGGQVEARKTEAPTSVYVAEWEVTNPDGDDLRYRLSYRRDGGTVWLPVLKETEVLTKTNHEWNTEGIPDGYYRVRVTASDELDNPASGMLEAKLDSEPFLVDNHAPRIENLAWAGGVLRGVATDSLGPVSRLERAVDGGDWLPFDAEDGIFDTEREPFAVPLDLAKGTHVVAVRAFDARRNSVVAEIEVTVR
jgi:hypothetical protein